jgi:phosphoglycolate phosphatase
MTWPFPPIDATQIERMVGKGSEHCRSVLNHVLAPMDEAQRAIKIEALFAQAWASYQAHYRAINGQYAQVYPVRWGLQALQARGLRLACLTNKPHAFAVDLLHAKAGWAFRACVRRRQQAQKADPLPLRKTCEALGTQPARTLMVGDSSNDAQAARAAAARWCW